MELPALSTFSCVAKLLADAWPQIRVTMVT